MVGRTDVSTMVGHEESILIVTEAVCYFHNCAVLSVRVAVQVPVGQVLDVGISLGFDVFADNSAVDVVADNSGFNVFADNSTFDVVADNRAFDAFAVDVFDVNSAVNVIVDISAVDVFVVISAFGVAVGISVFDVPVGISAVDKLPSQSTHFLLSHSLEEKEKSLRIGTGIHKWK